MPFAKLRGRIVQQPSLDTIARISDPTADVRRSAPRAGGGRGGRGGNLVRNCGAGNQDEATHAGLAMPWDAILTYLSELCGALPVIPPVGASITRPISSFEARRSS